MNFDISYLESNMRIAIDLAKKAWGNTGNNPMVGSIIVDVNNNILSQGFHEFSGGDHAEISAIENLPQTRNLSNLILYVTLEPCSTKGRTGACTDAIIKSGIKNIVIGSLDPNPIHKGRGVEILKSSGLNVLSGILEDECYDLNILYNHWIQFKRPLCAIKIAITLDGYMTLKSGPSGRITGFEAQEDVMMWRKLFPAVAVTHDTIKNDNPKLTIRLNEISCPKRFVFNRTLKDLSKLIEFNVFRDQFKDKTTLVYGNNASKKDIYTLEKYGINSIQIPESDSKISIEDFILFLSKNNIPGILFEPGPKLATSLLKEGLVDYLFCYQAPMLLLDKNAHCMGYDKNAFSMNECLSLVNIKRKNFSNDSLLRGFIKN